jgi:hypothetical protein
MRHTHTLLLTLACLAPSASDTAEGPERALPDREETRAASQLRTSARLLRLGESIEFQLRPGDSTDCAPLTIYTRYLETARPGTAFAPDGGMDWVRELPAIELKPELEGDTATVVYRPEATGSYLAVWSADGEVLHRYFAVIDDTYLVMAFSPFCPLEPTPTLHATGIPLDYRIPASQIQADDPQFARFHAYNRLHGDSIIPILPDTPALTHGERLELYGGILSRLRALLPDPNDGRSAWLECRQELDPGYTRALAELGIVDHCGLWCANATPWLGMPEFPYFASPVDCRKASQETAEPGVVAHQWDFCGGWHFMGPVSWHFKVSEGDWSAARKCMLQGVEEFTGMARMSGHPAFVNPLYEALDVGLGYPNPDFEIGTGEPRNFAGAVHEPFVCNRALPPDELRRVMADGLQALEASLGAWTYRGDAGVLEDGSGNGLHGEVRNGAAVTAGPHGDALVLDGQDDYVAIPSVPGLETVDFTFGCWVKPEPQQRQWANLLSSHNTGGSGAAFRGVSFEQVSDRHNLFRLIAGDGTGWWTGDPVQLEPGRWQHLAAVRQGRQITLFVDGRPGVENQTPSDTAFAPGTDGWRIGDWARGTPEPERLAAFSAFVEEYQRFVAFELPREHHVAYARSVDVADYMRRHMTTTPRTLFVSRTDHVFYDVWWTYQWDEARYFLVTRERLPWLTRVSKVPRLGFKDPLSYEFVLVEDERWSMRFERECPSPIWRFDYRDQKRGEQGSAVTRTETPDLHIPVPRWTRSDQGLTLRLEIQSPTAFPDCAIAVWGIPDEIDRDTISAPGTKELIVVGNTEGEHHLIVVFDLEPSTTIEIHAGRRR